jgi:hypothetical protein
MILFTFSIIVIYFVPLIIGDVNVDSLDIEIVETLAMIEPGSENTRITTVMVYWFSILMCTAFSANNKPDLSLIADGAFLSLLSYLFS